MGVVREFGIGPFAESATAWLTRPEERTAPATPRLAATVMLMRGDELEVFMIERATTMAFAPSTWVFPGGGVDPRDAETPLEQLGLSTSELEDWAAHAGAETPELGRALITAATRELFEEAGVLLASRTNGDLVDTLGEDAAQWQQRRDDLEAHRLRFEEVIAGLHLRPDLLAVVDRWITPEFEKRRFDAWFFAALLPEGADAQPVSRESQQGQWVRPARMLERADRGEVQLLPPTRTALTRMLRSTSAEDELRAAQQGPTPAPTRPLPHLGENGPYLRAEVNLER